MQFGKIGKIISAGALATVMAASTVAFATTLASYPAPFVTDGTMPSIVVVGSKAAVSDVVGAIDMAARLGAEPSVDTTVACAGCAASGAAVSVTGGAQITSDLNKTYIAKTFTGVKTTFTATDLTDLLATQTFTDKNNTQITYAQQLIMGNQTITYGTATSETEPNLYATFGSSYPYYTKVIFMGGLDTSAVDSSYTLKLFGKDYTFGGVNATNTSLELYSATGAQTLVLGAVGDKKSVTVGSTTYEFELKGYSSAGTSAYLYVNGQPSGTYGWAEGSTYTVGTTKVFVSDVSVVKTGAQEESATVKLFVGTDKLKLTNNTAIEKNDVALVNTLSTFDSSGPKINAITMNIAPDVDTYLKDGGEFVDPVFGSFKFKIAGMSNPMTSASRDLVTIAKDGNNKVKLTFTNKEGITYATNVYYNSGSANGWTQTQDGSHKFWTQESNYTGGAGNLTLGNISTGDYFVLSNYANKATYIYKYASYYPSATTSQIYVNLQDVSTGTSQKVYINSTDPYLRIGENAFKIVWINGTYGNTYKIAVDMNGDGNFVDNYNITMFTKGEANISLNNSITTPTINVTETPLYKIASSNEPTNYNVTAQAAYSANDVGFTVAGVTTAQVGTANKYKGLTAYGTYVESDTDADTIKVYYPGNRPSYAIVAVGTNPMITVGGSGGGTSGSTTTYKAVKPVTTSIAKLDSEVTSADKTAKNLILVGGPCVNDLVAELATAGKLNMAGEALTCAAWNAKSVAGDTFGLIQVIDDAFATGKAALVVAGSTADDTRAATSALQDYAVKGLTGAAVKIKGSVITPVTVG